MADAKGTGVVFLKNKLKANNTDEEVVFISKLPEKIKNIYFKTLSISWIPVEYLAVMMETTAEIVYPDDQEALFKLGQDEASDNLNGVYKVMLKMTTVPFLVRQTAKLWRHYHAAGEASAAFDKNSDKQGYMMVRGYPEFPASMREVVRGYISGALALTRARNISVVLDELDPQCWKWHCKWD
ncbi:hypothetical protein K8S19_13715 [bacterium]|nr:hypothetical protein [bacterium]